MPIKKNTDWEAGDVGKARTERVGYTEIGSLSVLEAALDIDERTITYAEALAETKVAIWTIEHPINFGFVRFRTDADADAWVVEMYGLRKGDESIDRIATLTLTGGKQEAGAKFFIDTIVATNKNFEKTLSVIHSADDAMCRFGGDFAGLDKIVFIASTIHAGATLFIDGTGH